jgi:adenine-specific DNA methylase
MARLFKEQMSLFSASCSDSNYLEPLESSEINNSLIKFPSTRYQGSKWKLISWILAQISDLQFNKCLDAFGGTGVVAFNLKKLGKQVTFNDILRFNYFTGMALIENNSEILTIDEVEWILQQHPEVKYSSFVTDTFEDIYFTTEENKWIDMTISNIAYLDNPYKYAIAFFALCQACIIKRPYNLFHRKNLYVRFAEVKRSFGNKVTWDKPFEHWFRVFVDEANQAVFDNGVNNNSINMPAIDIPNEYDLVYIDTPYISSKGVAVDYLDFYHFLEGLSLYDKWHYSIDRTSKHLRFKRRLNEWCDKRLIHGAFERLFRHFKDSILVVSYRDDGIPSESELVSIMSKHKNKVQVYHFGQYKYALSTNGNSQEILIIGT